ncbi:MAG: hypothetical protein RR740_00530 [Pseudomonas sp.]
MKNFVKEMLWLLAFVAMLIAFEISLSAVGLAFDRWMEDDIGWRTMFYMVLCSVAVAGLGIKVFGYLHAFVAKTRGLTALSKHIADARKADVTEIEALKEALKMANESTRQATANFAIVHRNNQSTMLTNAGLITVNTELADLAAARLEEIESLKESLKRFNFEKPLA